MTLEKCRGVLNYLCSSSWCVHSIRFIRLISAILAPTFWWWFFFSGGGTRLSPIALIPFIAREYRTGGCKFQIHFTRFLSRVSYERVLKNYSQCASLCETSIFFSFSNIFTHTIWTKFSFVVCTLSFHFSSQPFKVSTPFSCEHSWTLLDIVRTLCYCCCCCCYYVIESGRTMITRCAVHSRWVHYNASIPRRNDFDNRDDDDDDVHTRRKAISTISLRLLAENGFEHIYIIIIYGTYYIYIYTLLHWNDVPVKSCFRSLYRHTNP